MESPAFRRSTIVTTALVHSCSPPGYVADEKDLSPNGKVKTHNGCVVRENDKIILLKRVYTSPVRRSSRVRRKGCAVLHRSKVTHRHSEPAAYPKAVARTTKHFSRNYPKSAGVTPVRTKNREGYTRNGDLPGTALDGPVTPNNPATPSPIKLDFTPPDHMGCLQNLTEADFFRSDGTPKRRLVVKITETPEMKKKLAEISRPQFSRCTGLREITEMDSVLRDKEDAPGVDPLSDDDCLDGCENLNGQCSNSEHRGVRFDASDQGKSEEDFTVGENSSNPERRSLRAYQAVPTDDSLMECVSDSESASSNTLDLDLDEYQFSEPDLESRNGADDLKDTKDPSDEVLCISPLPFGTSDSIHEQSPRPEDGEVKCPCLGPPEFLPLQQNEPLAEFMVTPEHSSDESESSCDVFAVEDPSLSVSANSSALSRSPARILDKRLDEEHQFSSSVSPVSQEKLRKMNPASLINGLREVSVLRVSLSPSAFVPVTRIDSKVFDCADLLEDVCIVNLTPSQGLYNNMKGKEPSPTYASQANSESPCSPGSTSHVSKHTELESRGPSSLETKSCISSPDPGLSSKISSNHHDDFQDFSRFDFSSAQGPLPPQTFSPVEIPQKLVDTNPRDIPTKSPGEGGGLKRNITQSQLKAKSFNTEATSLHPSCSSVDVNLTKRNQEKCKKWIEMLESDEDYREESSQKGIAAESEELWMSASEFLTNEHLKPSRKKGSARTAQRRSSMRIAKKMSLLTLEADLKNADLKDADDPGQAEISAARISKTSNAAQKPRESCDKENSIVTRRELLPTNQPQSTCQFLDGAGSKPDASVINIDCSSTERIVPQESSSLIPTGLTSEDTFQCQFDANYAVPDDNSKPKRRAAKRLDKQSRRRSARLNPILINKSPSPVKPIDSSSSQLGESEPLTNSSCSDPMSTEEDFRCQFDNTEPAKTRPKTKRPQKQTRRRSARLNPITLPLPATCESDSEYWTSKNNDLDRVPSNSNSAESSSVSAQYVSGDSKSECFPVALDLKETETESTSASDCTASSREERVRDKGKGRRRRSVRLLKLSTISQDEDQSTMDQTSPRISSVPDKGIISGESISVVSNNPAWSGVEEGTTDAVMFVADQDAKTDLSDGSSWNEASSTPDEMSVDVDTQLTVIEDLSGSSGLLDDAITISGDDASTKKRPRRKSSVLSYSEKTKESKLKKPSKAEEERVKELYLKRGENKALKPNNLETIFEELHFSRTGDPLYTGSKKCKRAVNFPEHPWLPRKKKKKTPRQSGLSRGKKKASRDCNIDKKLQALLAEWTPASPAPSCTSSDYQADVPSQNSFIEHGSSILETDRDNPISRLSENSSPDRSPLSGVNRVVHLKHMEYPLPPKLRVNGEMELELGETSPKKPKRDTPFKGSGPSGTYGALLNKLMKNSVSGRGGGTHDQAVQE